MEWYPKSPADYRNDTWGLSLAGHGAYNLLIDHYMHFEAPLPIADQALASIIGTPIVEWLAVKDEVLKFFVIRNALVTHTRCDAELNTAYTKRRDGAARQERHRKLLKDKEPVTRPSRVSNAQEDRTGKDKTVEERKEGKKELSGVNGKDAAFEALWDGWVPYKTPKGSRAKAYEKWTLHVIDAGVNPETVIRSAAQYFVQCADSDTSTSHIASWLNQHRWIDDHDLIQNNEVTAQAIRMTAALRNLQEPDDERHHDAPLIEGTSETLDP